MKIYTKTGDQGTTGLYGGKRVSKAELQIETYGTVDELNSWLGLLASYEVLKEEVSFLHSLQSELFNIGSYLASNPDKKLKLPDLNDALITQMENKMDEFQDKLPELTFFILPGGSRESSECHVARTVCRRAERQVVALGAQMEVNPFIVQFLNRLSDFLFVLSRKIINDQGKEEIAWKPSK